MRYTLGWTNEWSRGLYLERLCRHYRAYRTSLRSHHDPILALRAEYVLWRAACACRDGKAQPNWPNRIRFALEEVRASAGFGSTEVFLGAPLHVHMVLQRLPYALETHLVEDLIAEIGSVPEVDALYFYASADWLMWITKRQLHSVIAWPTPEWVRCWLEKALRNSRSGPKTDTARQMANEHLARDFAELTGKKGRVGGGRSSPDLEAFVRGALAIYRIPYVASALRARGQIQYIEA